MSLDFIHLTTDARSRACRAAYVQIWKSAEVLSYSNVECRPQAQPILRLATSNSNCQALNLADMARIWQLRSSHSPHSQRLLQHPWTRIPLIQILRHGFPRSRRRLAPTAIVIPQFELGAFTVSHKSPTLSAHFRNQRREA